MDWYDEKTIIRIKSKIEILENGCWQWKGYISKKGYGTIGYRTKMVRIHRLTYQLLKGSIADGLEIDHLCRNRACCNPLHLETVTSNENTKRSPIHDRNKTHCKHGHEFTPENTMIVKKTGQRWCRTCGRRRNIVYKRKIKQLKIFP